MLGFFKKDMILLKKDSLLNLVTFLGISVLLRDNIQLSALLISIQVISMVLLTFAEDAKTDFFAYASGFPGGKRQIVASKYGLYFLGFLISVILNSGVRKIANEGIDLNELLSGLLLSFIIATILFSIVVPFAFKFGKDRGVLILFSVILNIFVFIVLVSQFVNYEKFEIIRKVRDGFSLNALNNTSAFITSLLFITISYFASLVIIKSNEFK